MQNYKKVYLDGMGFDETDFIPCEISGGRGVDIHHIIGRGKGGEDCIENLMSLNRLNHIEFGDKKYCMSMLLRIHRKHLILRKVKFDNNWFRQKIKEYLEYENEHLKT